MPFGLCSATATFQQVMAHALTSVTKKYGNLVFSYDDDVMIAAPTLDDHTLDCKPSKFEILKDSTKYLGRMVRYLNM